LRTSMTITSCENIATDTHLGVLGLNCNLDVRRRCRERNRCGSCQRWRSQNWRNGVVIVVDVAIVGIAVIVGFIIIIIITAPTQNQWKRER
jgi:hypothetical protein